MNERLCMLYEEDCRTAVFGKTERTVGWEGDGGFCDWVPTMESDRSTSHPFTLDCNVYVRSQRAGERVLRSLRKLYAKLHLRVNEAKTEVGPVFGRKFLGYCLRRWSGNTVKIAVSPSAIVKFKQRIRQITRRVGGRSLVQVAVELRSFIPGWKAYFHLARTPKIFRDLDGWMRRRLRAIQLKHWRRGRTTFDALRRLGASQELAKLIACSSKSCWHNSLSGLHFILSVKYYDSLGVPRLS